MNCLEHSICISLQSPQSESTPRRLTLFFTNLSETLPIYYLNDLTANVCEIPIVLPIMQYHVPTAVHADLRETKKNNMDNK